MSKRVNTILFLAASSLIQLIIVVVLGLALYLLYVLVFGRWVPGSTNFLALVIILFAALVVGNQISRRLMRWYQAKVDFDALFEPWAKLPPPKARDR